VDRGLDSPPMKTWATPALGELLDQIVVGEIVERGQRQGVEYMPKISTAMSAGLVCDKPGRRQI